MANSPRNTNNLSIANPHYNLGTWYVKCVFSWKQWVLTTHCFFQVTERVKEHLCFCCGMWRPTTISTSTFLFPLRTFIFTSQPRSGDDWGGGPQRPEGSHKDNMAMSLGNNIAEESSKGGDASVVILGASKIICCIIAISWFCVWTNVIWLLYQHTHISR